MVVKKTAEKKSASAGSTGAAAGKKAAVKETAVMKAAKKAAVKKVAEKKVPARKAPAGKDAGKKTAAEKNAVPAAHAGAGHAAPAKKTAAKKTAAQKAAAAVMVAAEAAEQTGAHTVVAKKSAARTRTAGKGAAPVPPARGVVTTAPGELAVRPGEDPWTPQEVEEARALLSSEIMRLRSELEAASAALAGLMRDSGDGAGDDEADTGTKNITREHEMSLAANAQEMLDQTERALARLDAGTYGLCEVCGNPIGKARMQAFPRATLCVEDKQKQERRG
ncbi:TraR/DksA family transcriptional regulator [Streptomyces sp. NPDC058092]|uniref:TraR/DksA family transcriptional regulator n=1 Tax=Streptomyces sp. NPDC058092 TaxID=3346336 RepID=UPI0036E7BEFC